MPLVVMFVLAGTAGALVTVALRRWPRLDPASPAAVVHGPAEAVRRHPAFRRFLQARLSPAAATGLALTLAVAVVSVAAVGFAVLVTAARRDIGADSLDARVARWASNHATDASTFVLRMVTELGASRFLFPAAIVLVILEYRRVPSRTMVAFVAVVVLGQNALSNVIKWIVDRVRPDIDPLAGFSGPSFPSGHTTAAAACFAAFALVLGRRRSLPTKAWLGGAAVAVAVAVGTTRVMLGVHWLTDVLGGLALGWAWFALCSVAFGGRLLRFGAPLEAAERSPVSAA